MKNYLKIFIFLLCSTSIGAPTFGSSIETYVYYHLQNHQSQAALNFLNTLEAMNHPEGLFFLGLFYLNGYGVGKDVPLANAYFFKAAHLGFAPAFKELADSYLKGDGITKSPEWALYYYECAARRGYGPGQFNAGIILKEGQGVPACPAQAFYWLNQAAHNPDLGDLRQDAAHWRDAIKF
mgnify:CR=1 FL=1